MVFEPFISDVSIQIAKIIWIYFEIHVLLQQDPNNVLLNSFICMNWQVEFCFISLDSHEKPFLHALKLFFALDSAVSKVVQTHKFTWMKLFGHFDFNLNSIIASFKTFRTIIGALFDLQWFE